MLVESDSGDILSPKYAPETTAPAVAARGTSTAAAAPISATPSVPAEPHEVPVQIDITAVIRNAVTTKNCGLISSMPQPTRSGMVPASTQLPINMPMASRIRITGSTDASFSPVERWTSSQVAP